MAYDLLINAKAYTDSIIADLRAELAEKAPSRDEGAVERVNPADLPYDQLIGYDQFAWLLGPYALKRRTAERYGTQPEHAGKFVQGIRLSRGKPIVFKAGDVAAWIAKNTAGSEVAK
ncbi:MAG: hypothetical protein ACK4MI_03915 [Brevundimonas sp.]|uniref:hypothetical protein n=1 Tax=Brevundimonas sp. TaxID=1871086 RepID=UPI00391DFB25